MQTGVGEHAVGQHCIFVREALAVMNRKFKIVLGGPGKTVYIDMVNKIKRVNLM